MWRAVRELSVTRLLAARPFESLRGVVACTNPFQDVRVPTGPKKRNGPPDRSTQINRFALGDEPPGLTLVIIRGINLSLPPLIGDTAPIKFSAEMRFMCTLLAASPRVAHTRIKVPIFGCSAFEYIEYLDIFIREMAEGKAYRYVCGRTDIQAQIERLQPAGRALRPSYKRHIRY